MGGRAALWVACLGAVLVTPLGGFECAGIQCATSPIEGMVAYWQAPRTPAGTPRGTVILTVSGRVFALYECELWGDGPEDVWWCE